jgi:hypothetical protein
VAGVIWNEAIDTADGGSAKEEWRCQPIIYMAASKRLLTSFQLITSCQAAI